MDTKLAADFKAPEGKTVAVAQFNKLTGALTMILHDIDPATLNQEYFVYRTIEDFDFEEDVIIGGPDDFEVVKRDSLPEVVYEHNVDALAKNKILKQYPAVAQVNVLSRAIMALSEQMGVDQPELKQMMAYINEVKLTNQTRKDFYKESPDFEFISYEDMEAENANRLEGGLHEAIGPRPATGQSFF